MDRDPKTGHFLPGWSGGPGRPPNRLEKPPLDVPEEEIARVLDVLKDRALAGHVPAAALFLAYAIGKPPMLDDGVSPGERVALRALRDALEAARSAGLEDLGMVELLYSLKTTTLEVLHAENGNGSQSSHEQTPG